MLQNAQNVREAAANREAAQTAGGLADRFTAPNATAKPVASTIA
jgi:hypothetical protein